MRQIIFAAFIIFSFISVLYKTTYAETPDSPPAGSETPEVKELLIDDFNKGRTSGVYTKRSTSIGMYQGTWAKRPSFTVITKSAEHRRGDDGRGLVLHYKKEGGWCGWYTLLGGVDVTDYNILSFWIKGEEGGERFDIGFADQKMQDLYIDAVYAGPIQSFLPSGITTQWQEVKVPLARVSAEIDVSSMGSIVLWFRYGGEGVVHIDDMKFKQDPDIAKIEEYNLPRAETDPDHPRSMWVWKIDPVSNLRPRAELLEMCKRTAVEIIYLYFGEFDENEDPEYTKKLEEFIKLFYENGIFVEVLTGNPTWALKKNHHLAIKWLKPFLEYNKSRPEEMRFHGVSFDVEPYLIKEWDLYRDKVKEDYLDLMQQCRDLIDSYPDQHFDFGGAIPIFYKDEGDFEEKILELVDYAALMDYYDTANDVIANAEYHVDLAEKVGSKIWIGLEIQDLIRMHQGMRRNTFFEEGWEYMEEELEKVRKAYADHEGFGGFAMHCYYAYRLLQRGRNTPQNPMRFEVPKNEVPAWHSYKREGNIIIDGKLDDWDLSRPYIIREKKNVVYGQGAWAGMDDLSSRVYSQWDKNTLYFAFEVKDNVVIQNKRGPEMWEGDHIEFWLDIDLAADFVEAVNSSDDYQFGFSPGNFTTLDPEIFIWTPPLENPKWDYMEIGSSKTENGYIIEVALQKDALYNEETVPMSEGELIYDPDMNIGRKVWDIKPAPRGRPDKFEEGYQIGYSADLSDCDDANVPQKCLVSSSVNRAWGDPTTFGILTLVGTIAEEKAKEAKEDQKGA